MPLSDYKLKFVIDADGRTARQELDSVYTSINRIGGSATAAFGGAIPVAGAAAAAFLGTAAAVVKVGTALYDITKTAAEYGSTIYDATQKTGLAATTISSLKVAADQSGSSLEAVTKGIAKFAKNYKGDSEDIQAALGDVMKRVAEAKPGFEQLTLAQKYFGKAGADLIPVIRSFDGDLPGLIRHMEDLGVTIDDKAAKAADEFGDQMDTLSAQVAGVGRTIGTELMPQFTSMANTVSQWLAQNKGEIADYASRLGTLFGNIIRGFNAVKNWIIENQTYLRIAAGVLTFGGSEVAIAGAQKLGSFLDSVSTAKPTYGNEGGGGRKAIGGDFDMDTPGGGRGSGTGSAGKTAKLDLPSLGSMSKLVISSGNAQWDAWFEQMGKKFGVDPNVLLLQSGVESTHNSAAVSPKGAKGFSQFMPATAERFGVDTSSVKDSIRGQAQYMKLLLSMFGGDYKKALAGYNAGEGAVQRYGGVPPFAETRKYVSKISGQYASRVRGTADGGYGTYNPEEDAEEKAAKSKKFYDDWAAADKEAMDYRLALRRSEAELAEEILRGQLLNGEIDEKEYADRIAQLHIDTLQNERNEIAEQVQTRENINKLAQLDLEIAAARLKKENDITDALRDQAEEREKAIKDLKKANPRPSKLKKRGEAQGGFGAGLLGAMGGEKFESEADAMASTYERLGNVAGQAISGLANAMGSLVENWVLYGSASEGGARKAIASALAMAAAQSTVSAIMETAYGIAALTPWGAAIYGPAAFHFKSAALFGIVAAGTALGGRAIAGDSFKNEKSGGRSSSSSGQSQRSRDVSNDPYSRVSSGAYMSGRNNSNDRLASAVEGLERKINSMRPGDVMVRGMKEKPGAVGNQAVSDMRRNPTIARAAGSTIGLK